MPEPAPLPAAAAPPPHPSWLPQLSWWQALLLYPALGSAVLAAIPTVWQEYKAFRLGVDSSRLQLAQEQHELWRRNLSCIAIGSTWEIDGPRSLVIKVTVCPATGDLLVRYFNNEWTPTYRWLRAPETGEKAGH